MMPTTTAESFERGRWTDAETTVLRVAYRLAGPRAVAAALNRSVSAVHSRAAELRIRNRRRWSLAERQQVRAEYARRGPRSLAEDLGRSVESVKSMAKRMGVQFRPRSGRPT